MTQYKWIAFAQQELERLIEIIERHVHYPNWQEHTFSEIERQRDLNIHKKLKIVAKRKEIIIAEKRSSQKS